MSDPTPELIGSLRAQLGALFASPDRPPYWIHTPDGDQGREWCGACVDYKARNLRRRDPANREDYRVDGGWSTEEDSLCHCAGCGVRLATSLTCEGVEQLLGDFDYSGFTRDAESDAPDIDLMLEGVETFSVSDDKWAALRGRTVKLAQDFVEHHGLPPVTRS